MNTYSIIGGISLLVTLPQFLTIPDTCPIPTTPTAILEVSEIKQIPVITNEVQVKFVNKLKQRQTKLYQPHLPTYKQIIDYKSSNNKI